MVTVDLTRDELKALWALCMAEMDEDIKSAAKKLTEALKEEQSNG